ncbi:MAG: ABC transporter permease [Clostridiaceae bacterium]|nr:ABC transporter permease [Clostridiaceae bacterium]
MNNLVIMTRLKLKLLLRRPILLVSCLVIPLLLSLLAGAAVVRNDLAEIRAAYVDLADNEESAKLAAMLESSKLGWQQVGMEEVERAIELGQVDGVIVIPPNFGDRSSAIHIDDAYVCGYIPGKDSLAVELIRNNYQVTSLAMSTVAKLEKDLLSLPGSSGLTEAGMSELLEIKTEEARREGANLTISFHNLERGDSLQVIQIPDTAVEVLFLSVYSLMSSLMLADAATLRRMQSLPGGFGRDFLSTLLALTISGILQLGTMVGLTLLLMPGTSRPFNYVPVMAVLLLFMLAFGQIMALIPGDRRFVPASLLLFVSIFAGGVLIRLPTIWMQYVGQYTPHGWAIAKLSNLQTTVGFTGAVATGLILLVIAYLAQRKSEFLAG